MGNIDWKFLIIFGLLTIPASCAPKGFPPTLVFNLFPATIISTVLRMNEKQRFDFTKLYLKYRGHKNDLDDETVKNHTFSWSHKEFCGGKRNFSSGLNHVKNHKFSWSLKGSCGCKRNFFSGLHHGKNSTILEWTVERIYVFSQPNNSVVFPIKSYKMFTEMKEKNRKLYDIMWPAVTETRDKLLLMNKEANGFFSTYMVKANELAPLLKFNKDQAVQKLLRFAVIRWDALSDEARSDFTREFPQMALSFEDKTLRHLAGIH